MTITERQFNALARVSGFKPGTATYNALKMVFCTGCKNTEAAKEHGLSQSVVANGKTKMLNAYASISSRIEMLKDAYGDGELLRKEF